MWISLERLSSWINTPSAFVDVFWDVACVFAEV
jgi:hypothetical protein